MAVKQAKLLIHLRIGMVEQVRRREKVFTDNCKKLRRVLARIRVDGRVIGVMVVEVVVEVVVGLLHGLGPVFDLHAAVQGRLEIAMHELNEAKRDMAGAQAIATKSGEEAVALRGEVDRLAGQLAVRGAGTKKPAEAGAEVAQKNQKALLI